MRALILNSDWTPLNFVSSIRALNLLFKGRAEIIEVDGPSIWEEGIRTSTKSFQAPATIRLLSRVKQRWTTPRFRKVALFNRDDWRCQYCGIFLEKSTISIDHVIPRCRGGETSWKNCVSSCMKCNVKKGSKTPAEAGMRLIKLPIDPQIKHFWETRTIKWHPDWRFFFEHDRYSNEDNRRTDQGNC